MPHTSDDSLFAIRGFAGRTKVPSAGYASMHSSVTELLFFLIYHYHAFELNPFVI